MKTMGTLCLSPLLLLLASCHYNGHILIAVRDMPVGTVLQRSDLKLDHGWTLYDEGACLSTPSHVLGHKTLRPLAKGETVRVIDIEGIEGSAVSKHTPNPCPENVADGWSGWL
jgi:flagella basal body P-ring formation protein FlgA